MLASVPRIVFERRVMNSDSKKQKNPGRCLSRLPATVADAPCQACIVYVNPRLKQLVADTQLEISKRFFFLKMPGAFSLSLS